MKGTHFKFGSKPSLIPYIQCILTSLQNKEWKEEKDQDDQWFNNPKNQFPFSISSFQIYKEVELPKNNSSGALAPPWALLTNRTSRWKIEMMNGNRKMPLNPKIPLCWKTELINDMILQDHVIRLFVLLTRHTCEIRSRRN